MEQVVRKSKTLEAHEAARIQKRLRVYGSKRELSRATGLSVQTIYNILKKRSGLVESVEAIQRYFAPEAAA
jgi:hypothetical protein